jgi:sec-independent protein translocase protein TatC
MSGVQGLFGDFWVHVTEFVKRMKIVLAVFLGSLLVMLVLPGNSDFFALTNDYKPLMSVLLVYINKMFLPPDATLFASSMSDPITLYVYAALIFAIGITLPVFAYQAYKFVNPALYPRERKAIFPFVTAVTALFILGAFFGFFFLAPSFIQGFFPFYDAVNAIKMFPIMDFYNTVFFTIIISGVLFTIPVFFVLLVKFNIVKTKMVTGKRKYAYAGLAIAAMLISPGATPSGDLYLFVALALLFEVSIFVGKRFERKVPPTTTAPTLTQFFSSGPTCRYCNAEVESSRNGYCPHCRMPISTS